MPVESIFRILALSPENVTFLFYERSYRCVFPLADRVVTIEGELIEGNFPDLDRVIPEDAKYYGIDLSYICAARFPKALGSKVLMAMLHDAGGAQTIYRLTHVDGANTIARVAPYGELPAVDTIAGVDPNYLQIAASLFLKDDTVLLGLRYNVHKENSPPIIESPYNSAIHFTSADGSIHALLMPMKLTAAEVA